jgi:YjbE family integral membrane protein
MDISQQVWALTQVIFIDLVLAGDNAIVVGMAASRVAPELRTKVIMWGMIGAVVLRILFAAIATQLLTLVGLTLAGGILLLWVCWKMYREIRQHSPQAAFAGHATNSDGFDHPRTMSMGAAMLQIIVADVSMSLDNVLAVAGAAKGNLLVLVIGLTFAVVFMGVVSTYIARLLARYHWITWLGLLIILHVAAEMIWSGSHQIGCQFVTETVCQQGFLATVTEIL